MGDGGLVVGLGDIVLVVEVDYGFDCERVIFFYCVYGFVVGVMRNVRGVVEESVDVVVVVCFYDGIVVLSGVFGDDVIDILIVCVGFDGVDFLL